MPVNIHEIDESRRQIWDYESGNVVIYSGKANPGALKSEAKWQIVKYNYDSSNRATEKNFANGDSEYDKVWNDRATYDFDPDS